MRKQCPNKTQKYDMHHNNQIFVKIICLVYSIFQLLSHKKGQCEASIAHLFFAT